MNIFYNWQGINFDRDTFKLLITLNEFWFIRFMFLQKIK